MNFLGIDIGTSSCKAGIYNKNGHQLAMASREYDIVFTTDSGAELDSDEVIQKCFETIKECTSQTNANSVVGLAISSQGEAFTAIDKHGKSICNAMVSSDMRARYLSKTWPQKFGEDKLYQITGHTSHPMFTLFKLLWLKENNSDIWKEAHKFLCFEDLLQFRLGLNPTISWPLAARTMMFDVRKHNWNREIMNALGLTLDKMAKPLSSGSISGTINPRITKDLGLSKNAIVVTGGHDQTCAALGAGITNPGLAMYATGTVECITPGFSEPIFSEQLRKSNLCIYDHTIKGMYVTVAFSLTGGNILKWYRDEFGQQEIEKSKKSGVDAYELILNQVSNSPSGLLVLPYFTPSGTPYFDIDTPGAILGLRLSTSRGEFIRALLEGITFEMRLNLDILEQSGHRISQLHVVGGGAKSKMWSQLKADITGKKIITLNITEAGCLGAAMLACAAYTKQPLCDIADRWVDKVEILDPNIENYNLYNEKIEKYRNLYQKIRDISI